MIFTVIASRYSDAAIPLRNIIRLSFQNFATPKYPESLYNNIA